jgi:hypothetical protein
MKKHCYEFKGIISGSETCAGFPVKNSAPEPDSVSHAEKMKDFKNKIFTTVLQYVSLRPS